MHFAIFYRLLRPVLFYAILIMTLVAVACRKGKETTAQVNEVEETLTASNPRLQLLSAQQTGVDFQNAIVETYENNITTNINIYNGGGLAVADVNNDNLPDLYFISTTGQNKLYLNEGGLKFKDVTDAAGLNSKEGFETAVTAVDINADGWLDLYVCRGGPEKNDVRRNKLYINNGPGGDGMPTFTEKAHEYGLDDMSANTGANFFDFDNDGDLDCYLLSYPAEARWMNKIEAKRGPDGKFVPLLEPRAEFDTHRFYRNDGNGHFTDVSRQAGVWTLAYGLSVSVTDFNHDGWMDVYVGNDFIQPDILYINNHDGTFTNRLSDYMRHTSQQTMGTDLTDFDNDGWVDILSVDMLPATNYRRKAFKVTNPQSMYDALVDNGYFEPVIRNVLQHNTGRVPAPGSGHGEAFSDIACLTGIFQTDWSWSGLLFDMDNDGNRDLSITNGYRRDVTFKDFSEFTYPEVQKKAGSRPLRDVYPNLEDFFKLIPTYKARNFCFQNKGNLRFDDVSGNWMTIPASWSCGSVWADLDHDGDLDLVVNNLEQPAYIYENKTAGQPNANYLQLKLAGSPQNPFAVGASVMITYGGQRQYEELNPTRGIFSSVEHLIHFGLGNAGQVDELTVRWPDGKTQTLRNVPANQRLILKYTDASGYVAALTPPVSNQRLFSEKTATASGITFKHEENTYNDFQNWPLIPWKVTELGPLVAKGDVNGDGLDDFFIGNSFDKPAALYTQQPDGRFKPIATAAWETDKLYEDHGATFFDVDNDKDLDLFVVSGGAEATNAQAWQCRLYINTDGKGNFLKVPAGVIPNLPDLALRVAAFDFDGDGDQDLFLGGRVTPGKWPLTPHSIVLRNDRNRFVDVTAEVGPEFGNCGMVTDLTWANVDADPQPELIVVGEWMPLTVFKLQGGKLTKVNAGLGFEKSDGLWNRIAVADLDGDGDMDLVTGNFGLNTRLTASAGAPLCCFAKDFDNNGTLDPIMAYYEKEKLYPFVQKEVLTKQMPILKKKFLLARNYAMAGLTDVWPQKDLDAAQQLYAYSLETCWWENQGGKFVRHSLPVQSQIAPVEGILIDDFNADGHPDILLAGNKYGLEVETGRCDSGNGTLLLGDGKGNFSFMENLASGFWATREVRDLALLQGSAGKRYVLVSNNHDAPQLFQVLATSQMPSK